MIENARQGSNEPATGLENTAAAEATSALTGAARAQAHHDALLERFRESLANEGESALGRWGLPLLHSLSDE